MVRRVWTGGPRYVPGDVDEDERRRDHLDALRHERETLARRIARLRALPASTAVVERDPTGLSPTGLIVGATKAKVLADEQVNLDEIDRQIAEAEAEIDELLAEAEAESQGELPS
jgi:hypothetical protein